MCNARLPIGSLRLPICSRNFNDKFSDIPGISSSSSISHVFASLKNHQEVNSSPVTRKCMTLWKTGFIRRFYNETIRSHPKCWDQYISVNGMVVMRLMLHTGLG
ncbi:hypothetical protein AVEN_29384-1 [Araneus ventricosus]|uniref:Uncharacterized protein n=1 Tax=Araneus ventricosus TaxID=182803 RepID=A0A4Y2K0M7_ARAVE|nr:hypothetical protein AVEN_29384-1 [Araneus ventricosus]